MVLVCPICKHPVPPNDGTDTSGGTSYFPFCSERCKLIDLGRWLDGKYQIPAVEDDLDESADTGQGLDSREA